MAMWKKRRFDDYDIDYDTLEELLSDVVESLQTNQIDLTKPLKVSFTAMLDRDGFLRVKEYGIIEQESHQKKTEEPLVDVIELENEIIAVIETSNLPVQDVSVKVLDHAIVISNQHSKKFMKKIALPCKVKQGSLRTSYNNNVLEVKLEKRVERKSVANEKR